MLRSFGQTFARIKAFRSCSLEHCGSNTRIAAAGAEPSRWMIAWSTSVRYRSQETSTTNRASDLTAGGAIGDAVPCRRVCFERGSSEYLCGWSRCRRRPRKHGRPVEENGTRFLKPVNLLELHDEPLPKLPDKSRPQQAKNAAERDFGLRSCNLAPVFIVVSPGSRGTDVASRAAAVRRRGSRGGVPWLVELPRTP